MKKMTLSLLLAAMLLSVTACGSGTGSSEIIFGTDGTADSSENSGTDAQVAPEFDGTEDLLNRIYEAGPVEELSLANIPVDLTDENALSAYTGLTPDDADKLVEATASEPMMGSQAYSVVAVELVSADDAAEIAQKMADNINPAKWICVEADNLKVATCGRYVLLAMISSNHSDVATVDGIMDAFRQVCGYTDGEYERS